MLVMTKEEINLQVSTWVMATISFRTYWFLHLHPLNEGTLQKLILNMKWKKQR